MQLKIKELVALSQEIATGIGRGYVLTECDKNDLEFAFLNLAPRRANTDTGETPYLQIPDLASVSVCKSESVKMQMIGRIKRP